MKKTLMAAGAAGMLLLATACGSQTDERVSPEEVVPTAGASAAASEESVASQVAAATPYVTLDCVSLQGMPVDAPPASAVNVGDAYAIFQPNGAPALTIATTNTPATELGYADLKVGDGAEATADSTVTVNYCGAGYGGQVVFDSSWARGEPATFPLSQLIPGWQQGIPGMKVGGQRLLVIPGALGYGESGTQGIAPNETLAFVIQLESVS